MENCIMEMDLQSAVNQIQTSKDPVGKLGELILASGCFLSSTEATDPSKIFNIQLYGVHGMGIGAAAALNDWTNKAKILVFPRQ
jgi:hypothetical protein